MCGRFDDPDETETEEYFQKLERKMRKFTFEPRLSEQRERERGSRHAGEKTCYQLRRKINFCMARKCFKLHFMELNFFDYEIKFLHLVSRFCLQHADFFHLNK